jgi:DNA repair protein RadC
MTTTIDEDWVLRSHANVATFLEAQKMHMLISEEFWVISLDKNDNLIHVSRYSDGKRGSVTVDLRHALLRAKTRGAAKVYLAHNHPDSPKPSASWDDWMASMESRWLGWRLGVPVLDHVIMGCSDRYYTRLSKDSRWNPLGWLFQVKLNPRRLLASEQ